MTAHHKMTLHDSLLREGTLGLMLDLFEREGVARDAKPSIENGNLVFTWEESSENSPA